MVGDHDDYWRHLVRDYQNRDMVAARMIQVDTPSNVRGIIMKRLFFLLIAIFSLQAHAFFGGFIHVTPDTQDTLIEEMDSFRVEEMQDGRFLVKVPEFNSRLIWLITCGAELADDQKELRWGIWKSDQSDSHIDVPAEQEGSSAPTCTKDDMQAKNGFIEVILSDNLMSRSYIYIDYPKPLLDGGFYYNIDLPAYLRKLNGSES